MGAESESRPPDPVAAPSPSPGPANGDTLQRTERWAGLRKGDPVDIAGLGGRGARWTFMAHVENTVTGEVWVDVVGGVGADRAMRSVRPERVYPFGSRPAGTAGADKPTASSPPLSEAPQLPLD